MDLDRAGGELRVLGARRARRHRAAHGHHELPADRLGPGVGGRGRRPGLNTHWVRPSRSRTSTKISPPWSRRLMRPAHEGHRLPDVGGAQGAAAVRALPAAEGLRAQRRSCRRSLAPASDMQLVRAARPGAPSAAAPDFISRMIRPRPARQLVVTGDHRVARRRAGSPARARAAAGAHRSRARRNHPAPAGRRGPRACSGCRAGLAEGNDQERRARGPPSPLPEEQDHALHADREADTGIGRAAEVLDEPVVAAAARPPRSARPAPWSAPRRSCARSSRARAPGGGRRRSSMPMASR